MSNAPDAMKARLPVKPEAPSGDELLEGGDRYQGEWAVEAASRRQRVGHTINKTPLCDLQEP